MKATRIIAIAAFFVICAFVIAIGAARDSNLYEKSGLAEVDALYDEVVKGDSSSALKRLSSLTTDRRLGANAMGTLKRLAPLVSKQPEQLRELVIPSLIRGLNSENRFHLEPAAYALQAYARSAGTNVGSLFTPILPDLCAFVLRHRYGGAPKAVVEIFTMIRDLDEPTTISLKTILSEADIDKILHEMPDLSVRPDVLEALSSWRPRRAETAERDFLARYLNDENPYVAIASICANIPDATRASDICAAMERIIQQGSAELTEHLLMQLALVGVQDSQNCVREIVAALTKDPKARIAAAARDLLMSIPSGI